MIRWKGIIFLGILITLVFVLSFIFTDQWLEHRLEGLGESIVGAKVEIDDLELSITQLIVSWQRLQVADPEQTMQNMIETGNCEFDLEFLPLLSSKIIIEDFKIQKIDINPGDIVLSRLILIYQVRNLKA